MKWDARGLWYWIPLVALVWSFFTDQPLTVALRGTSFVLIVGITALLRRRDPTWGRFHGE